MGDDCVATLDAFRTNLSDDSDCIQTVHEKIVCSVHRRIPYFLDGLSGFDILLSCVENIIDAVGQCHSCGPSRLELLSCLQDRAPVFCRGLRTSVLGKVPESLHAVPRDSSSPTDV